MSLRLLLAGADGSALHGQTNARLVQACGLIVAGNFSSKAFVLGAHWA
ncbi:MAG: hypothetical protein ACLPXB_12275 [Thiobacillaceae bacterium]